MMQVRSILVTILCLPIVGYTSSRTHLHTTYHLLPTTDTAHLGPTMPLAPRESHFLSSSEDEADICSTPPRSQPCHLPDNSASRQDIIKHYAALPGLSLHSQRSTEKLLAKTTMVLVHMLDQSPANPLLELSITCSLPTHQKLLLHLDAIAFSIAPASPTFEYMSISTPHTPSTTQKTRYEPQNHIEDFIQQSSRSIWPGQPHIAQSAISFLQTPKSTWNGAVQYISCGKFLLKIKSVRPQKHWASVALQSCGII